MPAQHIAEMKPKFVTELSESRHPRAQLVGDSAD
jgi:hypothetical protein